MLRELDRFQRDHRLAAVLYAVQKKYSGDNAGLLVVNFTYAAFVSIFPLLLVVVTVTALVLAGHPAAQRTVERDIARQLPLIGTDLLSNIHALHRDSVVGLVVGLVGLVYGATGVAQAGLYAMAEVHLVPSSARLGFLSRLWRSVAFLALLGVAMTLTSTLSGFGTYGSHELVLGVLAELGALVGNGVLFLVAFRLLTPGSLKGVRMWPGAILAGIGWTLLQALGGYFIGHDLRSDTAVYGIFAIVLGLVAWIYLGARITLYCAELNAVLDGHLWPRSLVSPPTTTADRAAVDRRRAILEPLKADSQETDAAASAASDEGDGRAITT